MDTTSPELQEIMAVIRREHRRTQLVFGVSIIILAVVIALVVPGIIRMESGVGQESIKGIKVDTSAQAGIPGTEAPTNATGTSAK